MEVPAAIDYVLALAREHRLPDVDLVVDWDEVLHLRIHQGQVEHAEQYTAQGLGVRVVQDGRTGLAFTERLERPALEKTLLAAKENAGLQDPTLVELTEPPQSVPDSSALGLYDPALEALTAEQLAAFGLEVEAAARAADPRVTAIPHVGVFRQSTRSIIASTHGIRHQQRANSVGAGCQALLEANGQRKSGDAQWSRRKWDPGAAQALGRLATSRAAALMGAKTIAGSKLPVVLDEYAAPQLLGMYFNAFSGEAAQKGQSRLKGRLGEEIAAPAISITDEPHQPGAPGSCFLDAEGVPTRPLPLIEGGRFANFLYHIESGRKEGRASTGHAVRGYESRIVTHSHNLVLPLGPHGTEALAALPPRCLLVTELQGGAGCNPLSGDISIGVQGFLVEQGRRVQPVDSVTIAGNFFDLLKSIQAVGNLYQPNLSALFIPPLLVEGLTVAG